jgi:hypothetical protein
MRARPESPGYIRIECAAGTCAWSVVLPVDLRAEFVHDATGEMGSLIVAVDPTTFDGQPVWDHYLAAHGPQLDTSNIEAELAELTALDEAEKADLGWSDAIAEGVYEDES